MARKWPVITAVLLVLLFAFGSCNHPQYVVTYAPFVVGTVPAHGETKVPVTTSIAVTFSEKMDPATFDSAAFVVTPAVPGSVSCNKATVVFTPDGPLAHSTTYTVVISGAVKDAIGRYMEQNYTFSFTTIMPPPVITGFEPRSGYEGATVSIQGSNLGSSTFANVVKIDGQRAHEVSASPEELVVIVPRSAFTGYITVSTGGGMATSDEVFSVLYHGMFWETVSSGITEDFADIIYTGSRYLAVGSSGSIYTSPDARSWSGQTSGTGRDLYGVAFSAGHYVAVGAAGTILTSTDAETWSHRIWSPDISFFDACRTESLLVVVGSMGTILYSLDGDSWTESRTPLESWFYGVTWADSRCVIVGSAGEIITSPDLIHWYAQDSRTVSHLLDVGWSDSGFAAVGYNGSVSTSPDGDIWTRRATGTNVRLAGVAGTDTRMLAVGSGGTILLSYDNGVNWTSRESGTTADLNKVLWDGHRYVVVGNAGTILISN